MSSDTTKLPDAEQLAENIRAQTAEETAAANVNAAAMMFTLQQTIEQLEPKAMAFEVPINRQFFRLGKVCELIQASPSITRVICERADVKFVASVDDVPFIDGLGLRKLLLYLDKFRREHEAQE